MSNLNKAQIVKIFTNNIGSYIGYGDIQEVITGITFLFWNAKYIDKKLRSEIQNQIDLVYYLDNKSGINGKIVNEVFKNIGNCLDECNLNNIFNFLDSFNEEELKNIICFDYSSSSRFNSSTPESLIKLVYKIMETQNGRDILDLCSYTGNYLSFYAKNNPKYSYDGIEINSHSSLISKTKLTSLQVVYDIETANALRYDYIKQYDKVFCHSPFNKKIDPDDFIAINNNNKQNGKISVEFSKTITPDWAFVCAVINSIKENGKGAVVIPNWCLYKNPDSDLRKELVEKGFIEAIIGLPGRIFNNTGISTSLVILSKQNKKIKFINAEEYYKNGMPINILDYDKIFEDYISNKESQNVKIIDIKDINDDYNLSVEKYMDTETIKIKYPKQLSEISEDIFRGYPIMSREMEQCSKKGENEIEYKIVNLLNVNNGKVDNNLNKIYSTNLKFDKYILNDGDLVVSSKGVQNKMFVARIKNNEKIIPSGNFTVIRLNQNIVNPYYIEMYFESIKGTKALNSIKSGGALQTMNMSQLKELNVPVPSLDDQNKVVTKYLAKNDEIAMMKSKLEKIEDELKNLTNEEF